MPRPGISLPRLALALFALGLGWLAPPTAAAQTPSLSVLGAPGGVVELVVGKGGLEGDFQVQNTGPQPVPVRVRLETRDSDPRLPPGVTVAFDNQALSANLAPGEKREIHLRWAPSQGKLREVYGHVALDVQGGTRYVGLHGELKTPLAPRLLSLLLALPLLGALAGWLGKRAPEQLRRAERGLSALQLALASWLLYSLDTNLGRTDGNEGLQFIERATLGPLDVYIGADGAAALVAWFAAASWALGVLLHPGLGALVPLAIGGVTLGAFSQNVALLWLGLAVGFGAALGGLRGQPRLGPVAALGGLSLGALALCFERLSGAVDGALSAAGEPLLRSGAIPALLRSDHLAPGRTLLGLPLAASAFALLCAGALPLAGAWPGGGWLRGAQDRPAFPWIAAPLALGILHTLVRLGALVLPEGVVWGAASLGWGGAALALVGGLGALGEASPRGRGGWWWNVQVGLVLLGLASGTPQGLAGALAAAASVALGWALQQARGPWMHRLGGLIASGSPGTLGFWGPALVVLGALPRLPVAAMAAAVGWALGVGAALRGAGEGEKPAEGVPAQELALLGVIVALGFWPGAWLVGLERWALDLASFLHAPGPGWIAFRS
ncbi:MAG: hypothetical protein MUF64_15560 [Polyangiaceae bacterium]|jgi:hypothetical protein|nr:hypothetical protein [Polyangiaceae bacterium]